MGKYIEEFEKIFLKTKEDYPFLEQKLARKVIIQLKSKIGQEKEIWFPGNFEPHLHNTLNFFELYQDKRSAYRTFAKMFFQNRILILNIINKSKTT